MMVMAARTKDASQRGDLEAGMAKSLASEYCKEVVEDSLRIHGAYGYSTEYEIERLYREAPMLLIGEGTADIQRIINETKAPSWINMVEGGKTPIMSAQELGQQGFRIVIFPGGTIRAVAHNLQGYFNSLKDHQSTRPWKDRMLDFEQLNSVLGTPDLIESGRRYEFD